MLNKYLIFKIIAIILTLNVVDNALGSESCWNNENECNIKTELFKNLEFSNGISMQIDCRKIIKMNVKEYQTKEEDYSQKPKNYLIMQRFMGVQSVMLDGCQTPLNTQTFGLEYLPICVNITKVSIRHFHMDILKRFDCNKANGEHQFKLEHLIVQFNEIAVIDGNSFKNDYSHLKDILIERNSLKVIHADAFRSLRSLEKLHIVNEPVLMLKYSDLFQYTTVQTLHLEALNQMTSEIFKHLPETLQNLYIANTQLDNNAVVVINALVLTNLTIKYCSLQIFTLHDVHSTVKSIDLSGNVMKIFAAHENNLKELNLSSNKLEWIPYEWFSNLTNLDKLILKDNYIKSLSLEKLVKTVPKGHLIDLSQNYLQSLQDYNISTKDINVSQVRLKSNQNPWDCLWLHEFAHKYPEIFRILQYEKFISKINVNGLECMPAEKSLSPEKVQLKSSNRTMSTLSVSAPEQTMNISTYTLVYGSPWEFKRNQRAEALIIVFMLPLGIALLFLLLYMWIYCQKIFHLSYYQDFSCMRRSTITNTTQRFDVVRQLPPCPIQTDHRRALNQIPDVTNEGYEVPLNGVIAECNCIDQNNANTSKCQKSLHITYEQLPAEISHQIYEEIIHVDDDEQCCTESLQDVVNHKNSEQTYDHLSFEDI